MILTDSQIIKKFGIKNSDRIIDIGGSMKQRKKIKIDTLVDIIRPEEAPYGKSKLLANNFVRVDVTNEKLPFKDKEFDFCLCTHTLEDLYNPFLLIKEMSRIAKRGYISTPSMGKDMEYSHLNLTDWHTGVRRVPGVAHHKWFFLNKNNLMKIIPKNYSVLYTSEFHISKWLGDEEFQFYWEDNIKFNAIKDFNIHELIKEYEIFLGESKNKIKKGLCLIYIDNPYYLFKELLKILLVKTKIINK